MKIWGIKLGGAGVCVPFCEKHEIVGVGWKDTPIEVLTTSSRVELREHVKQTYTYANTNMLVGQTVGQLYRFGQECQIGDIVVYYVPGQYRMEICEVVSEPMIRDFDINNEVDIWLIRKVKRIKSISSVDAPGSLRGSVLGPRMSFWALSESAGNAIEHVLNPPAAGADLTRLSEELRNVVDAGLRVLNERDWEKLVADFFRFQGGHIEGGVGGNRSVVDVVAEFDHGELPGIRWLVQVKMYRHPVNENELKSWLTAINEVRDDSRLCFVSVNGFTETAGQFAEENNIYLLESPNFFRFVITGRVRDELRYKMRIPEFWQLSLK